MPISNGWLTAGILLTVMLLLYVYRIAAQKLLIVDTPNARSLHEIPTIRGGGLVVIAIWLIFAIPMLPWQLSVGIVSLAGVSFLDDLYSLSATLRLFVQCFASALMVAAFWPMNPFFALFLFYLGVWSINHFNFMDGMDGFAAAQAIFILLAYSTVSETGLPLSLAAAVAGFLVWNFPRARIFMGDVGSTSLGFILLILALASPDLKWTSWFMLNGLFLFDATITLIRRMANGEKWTEAHRSHAYQRLHQAGMPVRSILSAQLLCNLVIAGFWAYSLAFPAATGWVILAEFLFLTFLYCTVERYGSEREN